MYIVCIFACLRCRGYCRGIFLIAKCIRFSARAWPCTLGRIHRHHHEVVRESAGPVVPLALYVDAAQYATRGSILVFVVCNLLLSGARHLCSVLTKMTSVAAGAVAGAPSGWSTAGEPGHAAATQHMSETMGRAAVVKAIMKSSVARASTSVLDAVADVICSLPVEDGRDAAAEMNAAAVMLAPVVGRIFARGAVSAEDGTLLQAVSPALLARVATAVQASGGSGVQFLQSRVSVVEYLG